MENDAEDAGVHSDSEPVPVNRSLRKRGSAYQTVVKFLLIRISMLLGSDSLSSIFCCFSSFVVARLGEAAVARPAGLAQIPDHARWPHPNRFDVEDMQAPTAADGVGSAKKARAQYWKILTNIAIYSLRVEDKGMREPHWHPDTVEMGYIHEGNARMSIMDPDGSVDTFTLHEGDVYFIPASYPHQIEVLGKEEIHFLIFFDQPMPKDVGFRQAGTVMGRRV